MGLVQDNHGFGRVMEKRNGTWGYRIQAWVGNGSGSLHDVHDFGAASDSGVRDAYDDATEAAHTRRRPNLPQTQACSGSPHPRTGAVSGGET